MDAHGGGTVLVVDDEPSVLRALASTLRAQGHEVLVAEGAAQGRAILRENVPDVVLLDIRMPEVDGYAFARELGELQVPSAVVMMSGFATMRDAIAAMRAGAVDLVIKPWSAPQLKETIDRAVSITRARRAQKPQGEPREPREGWRIAEPAEDVKALVGELEGDGPKASGLVPFVDDLLTLMAQPETSIEGVTAVFERWPELARPLLRFGGSAYNWVASDQPPATVTGALYRLGLIRVQQLVETIVARDAFASGDPETRARQLAIWRFALARAVAMRRLAQLCFAADIDASQAFSAGLFADVGATYLLARHSKRPRALPPDLLERGHGPVGAGILRQWKVPAAVAGVAAHHHDTIPDASQPYERLGTAAAVLAEQIAGATDPTAPLADMDAFMRADVHLRLPGGILRGLLDELGSEYRELLAALAA